MPVAVINKGDAVKERSTDAELARINLALRNLRAQGRAQRVETRSDTVGCQTLDAELAAINERLLVSANPLSVSCCTRPSTEKSTSARYEEGSTETRGGPEARKPSYTEFALGRDRSGGGGAFWYLREGSQSSEEADAFDLLQLRALTEQLRALRQAQDTALTEASSQQWHDAKRGSGDEREIGVGEEQQSTKDMGALMEAAETCSAVIQACQQLHAARYLHRAQGDVRLALTYAIEDATQRGIDLEASHIDIGIMAKSKRHSAQYGAAESGKAKEDWPVTSWMDDSRQDNQHDTARIGTAPATRNQSKRRSDDPVHAAEEDAAERIGRGHRNVAVRGQDRQSRGERALVVVSNALWLPLVAVVLVLVVCVFVGGRVNKLVTERTRRAHTHRRAQTH